MKDDQIRMEDEIKELKDMVLDYEEHIEQKKHQFERLKADHVILMDENE